MRHLGADTELWRCCHVRESTRLEHQTDYRSHNFLGRRPRAQIRSGFRQSAIQAAMQLHQKNGSGCVKLMWWRDEDFTYGQFRPMSLVRVQLGITNSAVSLKYRAVSPSIRQQPLWG